MRCLPRAFWNTNSGLLCQSKRNKGWHILLPLHRAIWILLKANQPIEQWLAGEPVVHCPPDIAVRWVISAWALVCPDDPHD
eukprot:13641189-Ditylum_brightwellii.AAC.1